jgi:Flp pilus assembly protein TadD
VLLEMARLAFNNNEDNRAAGYLRRILRHHPNHAEANLRLGAIYYTLNQTRLAKRHWAIAEQQARQENDALLLAELQITKNSLMYGIEPTRGLSDLLGLLPPDLSDLFGDLS